MLRDALKRSPPPAQANRTPKIYYATQVGVQPPTIVLFCSAPSALSRTYQRYLLGKFRDELAFPEVPIKLYLRRRHPACLVFGRQEIEVMANLVVQPLVHVGHQQGQALCHVDGQQGRPVRPSSNDRRSAGEQLPSRNRTRPMHTALLSPRSEAGDRRSWTAASPT